MDERGRPDEDDKGILDTVRRILSEDQQRGPEPTEARHPFGKGGSQADDDVLELESTMMIEPSPAGPRAPERVSTERGPIELGPELDPTRPHSIEHRPSDLSASREIEIEPRLVGQQAAQTARQSIGSLRTVMRDQRSLSTHRGGPTIEDVIRDEIRPMLREWLDQNLPALVEQLVRSEIARIVEREGA